jgi:histidinol-phosphate aminotransferase
MTAGRLDVAALARDSVRALPLYAPETVGDDAIDLSDSVNLWGTPPAALRALAEPGCELVSRYPSPRSESLTPALLRYLGLAGEGGVRAVTGCGSDDVLDAAMRAFGSAGDRIAYSAPTFSMVPLFARLNGLEPVPIPFGGDFDLDPERLVATRARITYLCAPNNPTGTGVSRAAVEYVASRAAGVVLLDEAYAEFAPAHFADLVGRHERLLLVRTFSKAFGMAGLRVGYAAGSAPVVGMVERARGPYKVSVLAERAARAALADTSDALRWVRRHARLAVEIRERVASALAAIDLPPLPSAANFLCIPTVDAPRLAVRLRERGVLVRQFSGMSCEPRALADAGGAALRVGIGPWELMQRFLDALAEARACE